MPVGLNKKKEPKEKNKRQKAKANSLLFSFFLIWEMAMIK